MAEEYVWECEYCGDTFGTKEECDRHEEECIRKRGIEIEFKRKCKECGKVWHSLKSREDKIANDIKKEQGALKTAACGMCGGSYSAGGMAEQAKRNISALEAELERLKICPNCSSHNYEETEIKLSEEKR